MNKTNILWWGQTKHSMMDPRNFFLWTPDKTFYEGDKNSMMEKPYKEKYIEIITLISL